MKISISGLRLFKACRRAYDLKYNEGLYPVVTADALVVGSNYHEKIESLYKTGMILNPDYSKESAMAAAYAKYIYPKFKVKAVEEWFEKPLLTGDVLVGRLDGIAEDGCIVEHKTTSGEITEEYEFNLQWDEQILAYMLATGSRKVWYTVCRKPTIRQKKGESEEEFFERMVAWYDEDTDSKIRVLQIERTDEEVDEFERELCKMAAEIDNARVTQNYYRNTSYCTRWGRRCEYASVCLHYNPEQDYVEFERRERYASTKDKKQD